MQLHMHGCVGVLTHAVHETSNSSALRTPHKVLVFAVLKRAHTLALVVTKGGYAASCQE